MYKLKSINEYLNGLESDSQSIERDKCINTILETLDNRADYKYVDDILVTELFGISRLMKGIFVNPFVKKKIKKLVDELVKVRVQLVKTQLEENPEDLESMLDDMDDHKSMKGYDAKILALQDQQTALEAKMEILASNDEKLERFVELQKIEAKLKANEMIIKIADSTQAKVLKTYNKEGTKDAKKIVKMLEESVLNNSESAQGTQHSFYGYELHAKAINESIGMASERHWNIFLEEASHLITDDIEKFCLGAERFGFPGTSIRDAIINELECTKEEAEDIVGSFIDVYDAVGESEQIVTFQSLQLSKNRWMRLLKEKDYDRLKDEMFVLVGNNYTTLGDHPNIRNLDEVFDTNVIYWEGIEVMSPNSFDVVIFGRKTSYGIKIIGIGHDGVKASRKDLMYVLARKLREQGYWMEAGGLVAHFLYSEWVKFVDLKSDAELIYDDIQWLGKRGEYMRSGKEEAQSIFGRPLLGYK